MAYLDARPAHPDSTLVKFLAILKMVHIANAVSVFVGTLAKFLASLKMVHIANAVVVFVDPGQVSCYFKDGLPN